jgi:hypothetical protein
MTLPSLSLSAMQCDQADNMIENGRPWKDIFVLFPTKIIAYQYFAKHMSQRFGTPESFCAMCRQPCNAPPIQIAWKANLHPAKTVLLSFLLSAITVLASSLYSRWVVVGFVTVHRLCLPCQRRQRVRSIVIAILQKALFTALILLLFLTVPMVVFLFAVSFIAPKALIPLTVGLIAGLGLLAFITWGFNACRKAIIPQSLRQIGRFPFFLYELRKTK